MRNFDSYFISIKQMKEAKYRESIANSIIKRQKLKNVKIIHSVCGCGCGVNVDIIPIK